jgi:hypothetical protein
MLSSGEKKLRSASRSLLVLVLVLVLLVVLVHAPNSRLRCSSAWYSPGTSL